MQGDKYDFYWIETHFFCQKFWLHYRLKKGKQLEKEEAINEVKKNIHLIKAPHAGKESSKPAVGKMKRKNNVIIYK